MVEPWSSCFPICFCNWQCSNKDQHNNRTPTTKWSREAMWSPTTCQNHESKAASRIASPALPICSACSVCAQAGLLSLLGSGLWILLNTASQRLLLIRLKVILAPQGYALRLRQSSFVTVLPLEDCFRSENGCTSGALTLRKKNLR